MSLATRLTAKADKLLTKYQVTDGRDLYKRVITRTGGDDLLGRPGTVSVVDTLLDPPPMVETLSFQRANHARNFLGRIGTTDSIALIGDTFCTISITALSTEELENKDLVFVFKGGPVDEEMNVITYDAAVVNNVVVVWYVLLRSKGL